MENLSNLPKSTSRPNKRIGRGQGSGKGKTAGRGTKGQKARGKIKNYFEGGQLPLIKRLPFKRGKNKNKPMGFKPLIVNIKALNFLSQNTEVTLDALIKFNIVNKEDGEKYGIKILGDGEVNKPLIIKLPISHKAQKKIEKAGGKVEWTKSKE